MTTIESKNILVLNCFSRNALAVIQNINAEYNVFGASQKKVRRFGFLDQFCCDKRLKKILHYHNPSLDQIEFANNIIAICEEYMISLVIPTGTTTSNALSQVKDYIQSHSSVRVAVEDYEKLDQVTDKWKCFLLAKSLGLHAPKTILLSSGLTLPSALETIGLPCVLKPRRSFASKGVVLVDTEEILRNVLEVHSQSTFDDGSPSFILQSKIAGDLHDVTSCSYQGNPFAILSQQRLVSLYDWGGGGIVNITTHEFTSIAEAKAIISLLQWNGVLQFDFIKNQKGEFYLIECNPKFWGTTQLTISAGLNVAQYTVDVFLNNTAPQEVLSYEEGLLYRWVFPEIIFHWFHSPFTFSLLYKRMRNTLRHYPGARILHNFTWRNLPHLLGITIEKGAG